MQAAKYWRNKKLRYRLIRKARASGAPEETAQTRNALHQRTAKAAPRASALEMVAS